VDYANLIDGRIGSLELRSIVPLPRAAVHNDTNRRPPGFSERAYSLHGAERIAQATQHFVEKL